MLQTYFFVAMPMFQVEGMSNNLPRGVQLPDDDYVSLTIVSKMFLVPSTKKRRSTRKRCYLRDEQVFVFSLTFVEGGDFCMTTLSSNFKIFSQTRNQIQQFSRETGFRCSSKTSWILHFSHSFIGRFVEHQREELSHAKHIVSLQFSLFHIF
jgi:hypothetical protein